MNTKEELAIALNHVILIKGFQTMSMAKLAESINVSRATLYIYFKNKDEIVESVVERHFDFIKKNPIPDFQPDNFLQTIINSLLLFGSTTETFTSELKKNYPELYVKFENSFQQYFTELNRYYQSAVDANFIDNKFSPDFLIFENRTGIRSVLKAVLKHELSLTQAESFLNNYFDLQLLGILTPKAHQSIYLDSIQSFRDKILSEFRATYSLIS
ncbi:TetR family transcriptional regulator [Companilactobacillus sp.]|uniref:TetR/AcrR family transcriptional regulator n=1 Tax=Companilactobacillus sp. TaxID=2767905 RepID=UPI0026136DA7|nr:TetR family transcriptional regulator [Companilactobacillus sp.]